MMRKMRGWMLNYNSVTKNEINQGSVSVKEISPIMKIILRTL